MKRINSFKKTFLLTFCLLFFSAHTFSLTLEKTSVSLNNPWGMSWVDDQLLITQKSGEIFLVKTNDYKKIKIDHKIPIVQQGQA